MFALVVFQPVEVPDGYDCAKQVLGTVKLLPIIKPFVEVVAPAV